jgi:hypothetical protein
MQDTYKILQTILEKVKDRSDAARATGRHDDIMYAILDNQERAAEAMLILGAAFQIIVDKHLTIRIDAPPKDERS